MDEQDELEIFQKLEQIVGRQKDVQPPSACNPQDISQSSYKELSDKLTKCSELIQTNQQFIQQINQKRGVLSQITNDFTKSCT